MYPDLEKVACPPARAESGAEPGDGWRPPPHPPNNPMLSRWHPRVLRTPPPTPRSSTSTLTPAPADGLQVEEDDLLVGGVADGAGVGGVGGAGLQGQAQRGAVRGQLRAVGAQVPPPVVPPPGDVDGAFAGALALQGQVAPLHRAGQELAAGPGARHRLCAQGEDGVSPAQRRSATSRRPTPWHGARPPPRTRPPHKGPHGGEHRRPSKAARKVGVNPKSPRRSVAVLPPSF